MASALETRWFFTAEELFVTKLWPYERIQAHIRDHGEKVSVPTLSAWNKKGDWNAKRARYQRTRTGVAEQLRELLDTKIAALIAEKATLDSESINEINKLAKAVKEFEKTGPDIKSMTAEVFGRFAKYIRDHAEPEEIDTLRRHIRGFMNEVERA